MPNILAYLVLGSWPLVSLWLFSRLTVERALIWTIVGGYMVLPPVASFDLPVMPALDKYGIANLSALMGCLIHARSSVLTLPRSPVVILLLIALIASPIASIMTNPDPLIYGETFLPGLRLYDALSVLMGQILLLLPFFLGRALLGTPDAQRDILRIFMVGGLVYSIPMLIEIRLSPQLNTWIYGFFQHSFAQMMRGDGFRPIVFMPHGLSVAFFTMCATVAATTLARDAGVGNRSKFLCLTCYLFVVLILCKSLGSLLYAIFLVPMVLFVPIRVILWTAFTFAGIAILYPVLRGSGLVPVEAMLEWARGISIDRAQSLQFRFDNETMLLDKANDRPLFGWGTWGRNMIYDPDTGRNISVTDGAWIIVIGMFGWLGYIAQFGLLTWPLLNLGFRRVSGCVPIAVAATAILLAINLIDLLPNAGLIPITWLMVGALLGYLERVSSGIVDDKQVATSARSIPNVRQPLKSIL